MDTICPVCGAASSSPYACSSCGRALPPPRGARKADAAIRAVAAGPPGGVAPTVPVLRETAWPVAAEAAADRRRRWILLGVLPISVALALVAGLWIARHAPETPPPSALPPEPPPPVDPAVRARMRQTLLNYGFDFVQTSRNLRDRLLKPHPGVDVRDIASKQAERLNRVEIVREQYVHNGGTPADAALITASNDLSRDARAFVASCQTDSPQPIWMKTVESDYSRLVEEGKDLQSAEQAPGGAKK